MNRDIDKYMVPEEAAHRWGVPAETVKTKLKSGNKKLQEQIEQGLVKFFIKPDGQRKQWIISEDAMTLWFGDKK